MKINDSSSTPKTVRLGSLTYGTAFKYSGAHFLVSKHGAAGGRASVVAFSDGGAAELLLGTQVLPLYNAELHTNE